MRNERDACARWIGIVANSGGGSPGFTISEFGVERNITYAEFAKLVSMNSDALFVCECVEGLLDAVHQSSDAAEVVEGTVAIIQVARNNRLVELQTVCFLIHEAGRPSPPALRNPWATLEFEDIEKMKARTSDEKPRTAVELVAQGQHLYETALTISALAEVPQGVVEVCGPLSLGIQTRGLIVAYLARRQQLKLSDQIRQLCLRLAVDWRDAAFRHLCKDGGARACFTGGNAAKPRSDGQYRAHARKLQSWIESLVGPPFDEFSPDFQARGNVWDRLGTRFSPPRRRIENRLVVEDRLEHWLDEELIHEKLAELAEVQEAGHLVQLLLKKEGFHIEFHAFPRLRPFRPSLSRVRTWNPDLFQEILTASGYDAIISMPDIDLRVLAREWEIRHGPSRLAQAIRDGQSPDDWLAAAIFEKGLGQKPTRTECATAHALILALATGLDDAAIPALIWSLFRLQIDPAGTRQYVRRIFEALPELGRFLEDGAGARILQCFGIDSNALQQRLLLLRGTSRSSLLGYCREAGTESLLKNLEASNEVIASFENLDATGKCRLINDITIAPVVTSTGRIRRGLNWVQSCTARFVDAVDDCCKELMFEVLRSGSAVLPISNSEFAVHLGRHGLEQFRGMIAARAAAVSDLYLGKMPLMINALPLARPYDETRTS